LDIYLNHPPLRVCVPEGNEPEIHDLLLRALQLWVVLSLHQSVSVVSAAPTARRTRADETSRNVQAIGDIVSTVVAAGRALLGNISTQDVGVAFVGFHWLSIPMLLVSCIRLEQSHCCLPVSDDGSLPGANWIGDAL
jgi:hypothetical protein